MFKNTKAPDDVKKSDIKKETEDLLVEFSELQDKLYASKSHALLIAIQGMDCAGKDGAIKKVFSGVNPQGCRVTSFKVPTEEELAHDFLWRVHQNTPRKGMIQIFNRSHYEDVLVTRVNGLINDLVAEQRMKDIKHFEDLLGNNKTIILKFFLNVSLEKQKERLTERMTDPTKKWKYSEADWKILDEREDYLKYYKEVIEAETNFPWTIVPSDQNWYKEFLIASTIVKTLKSLSLKYPE